MTGGMIASSQGSLMLPGLHGSPKKQPFGKAQATGCVLLRIEPAVTGDGHVQEGGMGRSAQYAAALGADWIASSG